ncbi:MAG: hypothetical protein WB662_00655 [Methyloceanibacter sp.]|jgi:hypothetical protein
MRKLITALAATAAILTAGSIVSQAEATPATGIGSLAESSSLIENVACWCGPYRCACGHPYYRPYRYGYYGYGYRPWHYGYRYRY